MKREPHLILHGLAIKKYAAAAEVAGLIGVETSVVAGFLDAQSATGRVVASNGRFALAPTTRLAVAGDYSRHYGELRASPDFARACADFERVNRDLKALVTRWQVVEIGGTAIANDHADKAYDRAVIDQLGRLHERAETVIAALSRHLPRLLIYRDKLTLALERAEDGAIEWVSDARIESYHTLWFELHEDLLCITGRERDESDIVPDQGNGEEA